MLSVTDQRALHGLARAFAADQEKQRGGKAANSRRKAVHCKLLELWSRSLVNLCDAILSCQPARHPVFAAKFIQVEGRRRQLAQPGFVVHKGTPLLPATSTEDSESEASVLEAPVDLEDLEAAALEEAEPASASNAAEPSASSSVAPVGSLERRSRSPQRSARADNRDLGSDARGLDSFGRLSSGRPLPPEPPVAPPRPSGTSSAPLSKARPVQKARPKPLQPSIAPLPKSRPSTPVQKARPKPPQQPPARQPAHLLYTETREDEAQFGSEIGRALRSGTVSPIDAILSLDFNGVLNRDRASSIELFRYLDRYPRVFIVVTSKCSTPSLITGATNFIADVLRASRYGVRTVPLFYCRKPTGARGKCNLLYRALTSSGGDDIPTVYHCDDRGDIVREFERWSTFGYHGVPVRQTDPRGLDRIVRDRLEL